MLEYHEKKSSRKNLTLLKIVLPFPWTKDGILYSFQVYLDTFKTKKNKVMDLVQYFPSLDEKIIKENMLSYFELLIYLKKLYVEE